MKSPRQCLVATLEVTCWAFSLGGEHYTGKVLGYLKPGDLRRMPVEHPLTAKEALHLNKKDRTASFARYKKGELSERFETREQIERKAIADFKTQFPEAIVLNTGGWSIGDPQRVLVGPKWFKEACNGMVTEWEAVGGYEVNEKRCEELFRSYRELLKKLEEKHGV